MRRDTTLSYDDALRWLADAALTSATFVDEDTIELVRADGATLQITPHPDVGGPPFIFRGEAE